MIYVSTFPSLTLTNDTECDIIMNMETSQKIRNTFERYRQTGKLFISNTPYGYIIKDKQIVVDEDAAAVVRMIFDMKISGMSNQGIADMLNDKGIKSPLEYRISKGYTDSGSHFKKDKDESAAWQSMSVKRILENPIYIGMLVQGKTTSASCNDSRRYERDPSDLVVFEHSHEAIITETVFYIVQDLLKKDSYTKGSDKKSYLFSGFAYCSGCGRIIYHENLSKGKTIWRCKNKECTCKARINEDQLKESVFKALKLHVDAAISSSEFDIAEMKELTRGLVATFIDKIEVVNKNKIRIFFRFSETEKH